MTGSFASNRWLVWLALLAASAGGLKAQTPPTYTITTSVSPTSPPNVFSVTITPNLNNSYPAGTVVQLTALPSQGWQFSNWSGDLSGSNNPITVTVNQSYNVTANFTSSSTACTFATHTGIPYVALPATGTSTVEPCPNGSGQPNCGTTPETVFTIPVTPLGNCAPWTATSSNPTVLQVTSGATGTGVGQFGFTVLNNTHTATQALFVTVVSGGPLAAQTITSVYETGSGDSEFYRQVYALYEQLLGRDPDPAGFQFWTGSGSAGLGQMADSFLTGSEAYNTDFAVMAAYQAATGAPPTYAEYNLAVNAIRTGAQTVPGLFNSLISFTYTAANLYQNLLSRAPGTADSGCIAEGLEACFQTIVGYPARNTPVGSDGDNEFQNTGIYHTAFSPDHSNALYVRMIYYVTLSRDPDAGGLGFWTGVANLGGPGVLFQGIGGSYTRLQILGPGAPNQGFIGSPEFQSLFAN